MNSPKEDRASTEGHGLLMVAESSGCFVLTMEAEPRNSSARHMAAAGKSDVERAANALVDLLEFAQWCISTKFDSRELSQRARDAIAKATGAGS